MTYDILKGLTPLEIAGFQVYTLEETDSTNTDVLNLARAGAPDGIVLFAKSRPTDEAE